MNIQGWSTLTYLDGFASGGCSGNDCQVIGRFVKADISMGRRSPAAPAPTSVRLDPDSLIQFERLVE